MSSVRAKLAKPMQINLLRFILRWLMQQAKKILDKANEMTGKYGALLTAIGALAAVLVLFL